MPAVRFANPVRRHERIDVESAVPALEADAASVSCFLHELRIYNPTAQFITVTVKSKTTAVEVVPATPVPPNGWVSETSQKGLYCEGGITWVATGVGLKGRIMAEPS